MWERSISDESEIGLGTERIQDQRPLPRMRRKPTRHLIGRQQRRPVDLFRRVDAGPDQERELPLLLPAQAAVGTSSDAWFVSLQVVLLRDQAVAPHETKTSVLEAFELPTYSMLKSEPEATFSIIQGCSRGSLLVLNGQRTAWSAEQGHS